MTESVLIGTAIVERRNGGRPLPILGAHLERTGHRLLLRLDCADWPGPFGLSEDSRSVSIALERTNPATAPDWTLELSAEPRAALVGYSVSWATGPGSQATELIIRPVVPSDAMWLSALGFLPSLTLPIIEELARLRARSVQVEESVAVLGFPRTAPHALEYCVSSRETSLRWYWSGGRWCTMYEFFGTEVSERLRAADEFARRTPWMVERVARADREINRSLSWNDRGAPWESSNIEKQRSRERRAAYGYLLDSDVPRTRIQPWSIDRAMALIERSSEVLDELAVLIMGSSIESTIESDGIGIEMNLQLEAIAEWVERLQLEQFGDEAWALDTLCDQDATLEWHLIPHMEDRLRLARLNRHDLDIAPDELLRLLDVFADLREGWTGWPDEDGRGTAPSD
jgi:hypothetical protein